MKEYQGAINVTTFLNGKLREKHYPQLHFALDRQLRQLRELRIGVECKRAEIITPAIEDQLWEEGVMGVYSPQALLNVFFIWAKSFVYKGLANITSSHFRNFLVTPILIVIYTKNLVQKTIQEV